MAHRRKYKTIPHTIIRAGYYYINLRSNGSLIRISLQTTYFEQALQIISGLIYRGDGIKKLKQMDRTKVKHLIASVRTDIVNNSVAIIDPTSNQAEVSLIKYNEYYEHMYLELARFSSLDGEIIQKYDIQEPAKFKNLREFKLDCLHPQDVSPSTLARTKAKEVLSQHVEEIDHQQAVNDSILFEEANEQLEQAYIEYS
jgi:hypothetical protein